MTNATRIAQLESSLARMEALLVHVVEQAQAPQAHVPALVDESPAPPARKARAAKTTPAVKPYTFPEGVWNRYGIGAVGSTFQTRKSGNTFRVVAIGEKNGRTVAVCEKV